MLWRWNLVGGQSMVKLDYLRSPNLLQTSLLHVATFTFDCSEELGLRKKDPSRMVSEWTALTLQMLVR